MVKITEECVPTEWQRVINDNKDRNILIQSNVVLLLKNITLPQNGQVREVFAVKYLSIQHIFVNQMKKTDLEEKGSP